MYQLIKFSKRSEALYKKITKNDKISQCRGIKSQAQENPEENEKNQAATGVTNATTAETDAETAFNKSKAEKAANLDTQIKEIQSQITDLETIISSAESISGAVGGGTSSATVDNNVANVTAAQKALDDKLTEIRTAAESGGCPDAANKTIDQLIKWINASDKAIDYQYLLAEYDALEVQLKLAQEAAGNLSQYQNNTQALAGKQQRLAQLNAELASLQAQTYTPGDSVEQAQAKLNQATQNLNDKTNSNKQC